MNTEVWKDIIGLEGKYQVSSLGRVKSLARFIGYGKCYLKPENILKLQNNKDGYKMVILALLKRRTKSYMVHQLVAEAFLGPRKKGVFVCHMDGEKTNNCASNLYYGDIRTNTLDLYRHGRTKFSQDDIIKIRELAKAMSQYKIAALYNVGQGTISRIINKKRSVFF